MEQENKEKQQNGEEVIGDSFDNKSLVEGKENESRMLEAEAPNVINKVINQSEDNTFEYDEDDII